MAAIGIDLGTTNSVVAYSRDQHSEVLACVDGEFLVPSVVQYADGEILVGKKAKENLAMHPGSTIWSIKRFIGRTPGDPKIEQARRLVSYRLEEPAAGSGDLCVRLGTRTYTPADISALILRKLVEHASQQLGETPQEAVITVPAYFSERQKALTHTAGEQAGLNVLRILDEPTAAAMAYGMTLNPATSQTVLVFDLGGGTFDVSVLQISNAVPSTLKIAGDNFLGGDDFDNVLINFFLEVLQEGQKSDLSNDLALRARLKKEAEAAKIGLSTAERYQVDVFMPATSTRAPIALSCQVERSWFEKATKSLLDRAMAEVDRALRGAYVKAHQVDKVLLVGGGTLQPTVRSAVMSVFAESKVCCGVPPMLCVAQGAACLAETLSRGVGKIPTSVTAKSLGIELATPKGKFDIVLPHGTRYPTVNEVPHLCKTTVPGQTEVRISVYEGEAELARANDWMADVRIPFSKGLPPGTPVDVWFRLDHDAILFVSVVVRGHEVQSRKDIRVDRQRQPMKAAREVAPVGTAISQNVAFADGQTTGDHTLAVAPAEQLHEAEAWKNLFNSFLICCYPLLEHMPSERKKLEETVEQLKLAIKTERRDQIHRALKRAAMVRHELLPEVGIYNNTVYYAQRGRSGPLVEKLHACQAAIVASVERDHGTLGTELGRAQNVIQEARKVFPVAETDISRDVAADEPKASQIPLVPGGIAKRI